jgi:glycosidase
MNNTANLNLITDKLNQLKSKKYKSKFSIPGLWIGQEAGRIEINPFQFFLNQIKKIESESNNINPKNDRLIYNMYIRLTTAYDHNEDNSLDNNVGFFKETGTFLKAIALLPYIKSLGVNTIYLLPVTSIGEDEKKGNLGSPYAIRNPYKQDSNLSEPILGLDTEVEFRAFSEAVHLLGMDLVCEFVFRTASVDSDLSLEHPEWFYWINNRIKNREKGETSEAKYGPPIFLKRELEAIKHQVNEGNFNKLIPPHEQYQKMFTETPKKVARVDTKIRGLLSDKKTEVRIPGAFADWPPDDNQPAWSDVTYLKLYDNPKFNYLAYNTVRMYDTSLTKSEYIINELWDFITGIIPHYIEQFNIDGVMIDMGHALPSELRKLIVQKALEKKNNFFFWEENFTVSEKSVNDGYSAVLGYMTFDSHQSAKIKELISRFNKRDFAINFFATAENHNTPRSISRINNINYLKSVYAFASFLPALTFIHSGFELAESNPVNTGLDFTNEQITQYPPEKLGLFSAAELNWDNADEISSFIRKINAIKLESISEPDNIFENDIYPVDAANHNIVGFVRRDKIAKNEIIIATNYEENSMIETTISSLAGANEIIDLLNNEKFPIIDGKINIHFNPFELKILKLVF